MTNAEAIEILKSRRMCAEYVDSEYVDSVDIEAIDMAIAALEKQEGKKPISVETNIPAADVVEEENILKFYYVRSIDEYWIGQRIDNFYYAEYDPKSRQWVWTHSRYLPWGEHIVSPTSLWKEHTYPSEPEEIPFAEWLQGFIKKHAADVVEVVRCSDCEYWDRNNEARLDRGCYFCSCFGGYTRPTFYCAVGERKGGAEDAVDN